MDVRDTAQKFVRYLATGGSAAVVDLGSFLILFALGMPPVAAAALSFLIAAAFNYVFSSRYAFGVALSVERFMRFLAGATLGFFVNTGATAALIALGAPPPLAKVLAIGIAFTLNFAVNLLLVFRRP